VGISEKEQFSCHKVLYIFCRFFTKKVLILGLSCNRVIHRM
jgi:hypothetical protein